MLQFIRRHRNLSTCIAFSCISSLCTPCVAQEWVWNDRNDILYWQGANDDKTAYEFRFLAEEGMNFTISSSPYWWA